MRLSEKLYCIPILGVFIAVFCYSPKEHRKMSLPLVGKMGIAHAVAAEALLIFLLIIMK